MSNGRAMGAPVDVRPAWMIGSVSPETQVAFFERGVCEVCETIGPDRWSIGPYGYVYCVECATTIIRAAAGSTGDCFA